MFQWSIEGDTSYFSGWYIEKEPINKTFLICLSLSVDADLFIIYRAVSRDSNGLSVSTNHKVVSHERHARHVAVEKRKRWTCFVEIKNKFLVSQFVAFIYKFCLPSMFWNMITATFLEILGRSRGKVSTIMDTQTFSLWISQLSDLVQYVDSST